MSKSSYAEKAKKHLALILGEEQPKLEFGGSFCGQRYDHILKNEDDRYQLLMDPDLRNEDVCKELFGGKLQFQRYAHHANSSQIYCLNLFGPLVKQAPDFEDLRRLLKSMGIVLKGKIDKAQFEYTPEDSKDRTWFDFYVHSKAEEEVFFEIKYTENEFGKPSKGSYKKEEKDFYRELCQKSLLLKHFAKNPELADFYKNFQVCRNIGHVTNEKQFVVFIFPKGNNLLTKKYYPEIESEQVRVVHSEDIAEGVKNAFPEESPWVDYYARLHERYFCFDGKP